MLNKNDMLENVKKIKLGKINMLYLIKRVIHPLSDLTKQISTNEINKRIH